MDRELLARKKKSESALRYYYNNRDKVLAYQREYRKRVRERLTDKDRELERMYAKLRRDSMTPEERKKWLEYRREYYRKNQERIKAYQREYHKLRNEKKQLRESSRNQP